ncbi:MAG TPA: hypothetical protein PLF42_17890, partial [Anaerolineales bacterium]|nr:hypothetical protein [Anaerolineales bacterium]
MSVHIRNSLFALGILTLVSLACVYLIPDEKYYYPDPEVEVSGDVLDQWDATKKAADAATRAARPTLAVDSPSAGGCYWRNSEIAPPADTTSNPNMDIEVSEPMSVFTKLKHGVSGCAAQYFYTQHRWRFSSVMRPGESQKLQV